MTGFISIKFWHSIRFLISLSANPIVICKNIFLGKLSLAILAFKLACRRVDVLLVEGQGYPMDEGRTAMANVGSVAGVCPYMVKELT